jgi:hypothetical protein
MADGSLCRRRALSLLIIVASLGAFESAGSAQSLAGDTKAQALRSMVVKISAVFGDGHKKFGVGIIVGEQNNRVVIITANHVVTQLNPDAPSDNSPHITFFENQGTDTIGALQKNSLPIYHGDLAVILADKPPKLTFVRDALSTKTADRGLEVRPIMRSSSWDVPVTPGRVSGINADGHILVEGLGVTGGDSGGPIVANDGMIGMMITDGGDVGKTEVLPFDTIRKFVEGEWHYAWQLGSPMPTKPAPLPGTQVSTIAGTADSACADLKTLISMSEQDFISIRKGEPRNDKWEITGPAFFGFKSCYVQKLTDVAFFCEGTSVDSQAVGTRVVNQLVEKANTCLGSSWRKYQYPDFASLNNPSSGVSLIYSAYKMPNFSGGPLTYMPTMQVYQHRETQVSLKPEDVAKRPIGDAYCNGLKDVVKSTQSKFNDILGRKLDPRKRWISRIQLEGWQGCEVNESDDGATKWFSCELSPIPTNTDADRINEDIAGDLKICLGNDWAPKRHRQTNGQLDIEFVSAALPATVELRSTKNLDGTWENKLDVNLQ